ncbi:hypothetical protein Pcinc_011108 [Petrolisthes cinctipes]|uniref:Uncharacterized protein n=1 Tax=Petrolisthes cinctipes TaxID=88211 RepID=A0AAE1G1X7_PETCI|nr:hypothetical protein Pcinc_011108 [Petrolisthes cinctipes]
MSSNLYLSYLYLQNVYVMTDRLCVHSYHHYPSRCTPGNRRTWSTWLPATTKRVLQVDQIHVFPAQYSPDKETARSVFTLRGVRKAVIIQTLVSASAVTPCATNTARKLAGAATVTIKAQRLSAAFLKPSHLSL